MEDTNKLIESIDSFIEKASSLLDNYGLLPEEGSISSKELSELEPNISLKTAYSQGHIFVEVAGDQLMAFVRTLKPPIQTIAPFTNARAVLESCSLAIWMLDNSISSFERVSRSFAFRFQGLKEQRKLQASTNSDQESSKIEERLNYIIKSAESQGIPILREKKSQNINGVGVRIPSSTSMAKDILDKEFDYRLLSSVTHAHHFALQQTSFMKIGDSNDVDLKLFKKALSPSFILFLSNMTVEVFISALSCLTQIHGTFNNEYELEFEKIRAELRNFYAKLNS